MDTLDVQFARGIKELIFDGLDFDKVAQETLREVVGDSPFLALLPSIDKRKQAPESFIQSLSGIFPATVVRTLVLIIVKKAIASLSSPREAGSYPETQSLVRFVLATQSQEAPASNKRILHDHRDEDELDQLVGHKTD